MPVVVSDTSPLIYLASVGQFDLLRLLYGTVLIPGAVWSEMTECGSALAGAKECRAAVDAGWVRIETVEASPRVVELAADQIDTGEMEAISLASSLHAILIIDDLDGRRVARLLGVEMTGTLGVLVRAKHEKHIARIRPSLERLVRDTNFRISRQLIDSALAEVSEPPL